MSGTDQMTLALVMTNAGGEGKSTWAETLAAFGKLAGKAVTVVDVDAGNRGYLNRNGDGSALSLDWSPRADNDGTAPADPGLWFERHLAGQDLAVLDTGANMLAAANPISRFIAGLIQVAKASGARIVIHAVTSPHKPGSDELIEAMYQRFHRVGEVVIVQNDRDGSKAFASSLSTLGTPVISLPHLEPGLQALRLHRRVPLDMVLTNPEPGHGRATALIAKKLLMAAKQEAVTSTIGEGAAEALARLAIAAPASLYYRITSFSQTRDDLISANEALSTAWYRFRRVSKTDASGLLAAAIALRDAERAARG